MKAGLLESQFAALEEPEDALSVDIDDSPNSIADSILRRLQSLPARKTGSDK
jgi:gluconate kinase